MSAPIQLEYYYTARFNTLDNNKNFSQVLFDIDSICYVTLNPNEEDEPVYLVAYDIMQKPNNCQANSVSLLPTAIPLFPQIIGMIFSCFVEIFCDMEGKQYEQVLFDEISMPINYFIVDQDIEEINQIRQIIRDYLTQEKLFLSETHIDVWSKLKQFFFKERIKHIK